MCFHPIFYLLIDVLPIVLAVIIDFPISFFSFSVSSSKIKDSAVIGMTVQEQIQDLITNTSRNLSGVSDEVRTGRGTHVHVTPERRLFS